MLANQVEGNMEYSFQEGDTKTPISFLNELKTQSGTFSHSIVYLSSSILSNC